MVNLTLNKKRLLGDLGMNESDDLYHQLAMFGIEVEDVGKEEITVDITPNRPDLLSQPGVTRAMQAFLNKPTLKEYKTSKSKLKVRVDPSVKDVRPFTACAVATNLKLDDEKLRELIDIQEKLHVTFCRKRKRAAIGVYPMEAIKGNITYTALPSSKIKFRPLESSKAMTAKEILTKHPKGKEYAHLLRRLKKYPVFLDSKGDVLSMPPVINSHKTGKVTGKTKEIFIEASGSDFRICHEIIQMICCALADMGATIKTVDVLYGRKTLRTPNLETKRQQFYRYYVNRRLGTDIKKHELPKLLGRMGLGFQDGRIRETHYALLPPYRVDFLHQIDVVEDLAIAFGYDNIKAELPNVVTVAQESMKTKFARKLRDILVGHGFLEAKNYHLMSSAFQKKLGENELVTLQSSVSEEYDSLRKTLLPCLLQSLTRNKVHEYPQKLFEIGTVFSPKKSFVQEEQQIAGVLAGDFDYTRIRQIVDSILLGLGLSGTFSPSTDARFLQGRCAKLTISEKEIGVLGELSPRVLTSSELSVPCAAFELSCDALRDARTPHK